MDKYPLMRFVGRYFRGIARGFCWKGLWGGGYICGYVDSKDGSFSGRYTTVYITDCILFP